MNNQKQNLATTIGITELIMKRDEERTWKVLEILAIGVLIICLVELAFIQLSPVVDEWLNRHMFVLSCRTIAFIVECFVVAIVGGIACYRKTEDEDLSLPVSRTSTVARWIISIVSLFGCIVILLKSLYIAGWYGWEGSIGFTLLLAFVIFSTDLRVRRHEAQEKENAVCSQEDLEKKYENLKESKAQYQGTFFFTATMLAIAIAALVISDLIPDIETAMSRQLMSGIVKEKVEIGIGLVILILTPITSNWKKIGFGYGNEVYYNVMKSSYITAFFSASMCFICEPDVKIWNVMMFVLSLIWIAIGLFNRSKNKSRSK